MKCHIICHTKSICVPVCRWPVHAQVFRKFIFVHAKMYQLHVNMTRHFLWDRCERMCNQFADMQEKYFHAQCHVRRKLCNWDISLDAFYVNYTPKIRQYLLFCSAKSTPKIFGVECMECSLGNQARNFDIFYTFATQFCKTFQSGVLIWERLNAIPYIQYFTYF